MVLTVGYFPDGSSRNTATVSTRSTVKVGAGTVNVRPHEMFLPFDRRGGSMTYPTLWSTRCRAPSQTTASPERSCCTGKRAPLLAGAAPAWRNKYTRKRPSCNATNHSCQKDQEKAVDLLWEVGNLILSLAKPLML